MRSKDTQLSLLISYSHANTGDELLQVLDDIVNGEIECFLED